MATNGLNIHVGEKYALIAIHRLALDWANVPLVEEVCPGFWYSQQPPLGLADHWKEWIGSVRAKQLAEAQLCLCVKATTAAPRILDEENKRLLGSVGRFYQGLLLAVPLWVDGELSLLTGANSGDGADVRSISVLVPPAPVHYGTTKLIGANDLHAAAQLVPVLNGFPAGKYLRLQRALNAYATGITEKDLRERLHQFCRVIEGLILPDEGKTTKQFKSRTELFVGPGQHDLMGGLYECRSVVEHMNDPEFPDQSDRGKYRYFYEWAALAEEVARSCLRNALLSPTLLRYFESDTTLASFWKLDAAKRSELWGPPLEMRAVLDAAKRGGVHGQP
jgi:hypothetical protein